MTKEGLQKALGQLFDVAKEDPNLHLRFDKSLLDTIERLEKEDQGKTWRDYAPDDPEGLRPWVEYNFNEMVKAGYFFVKDDEKAKKIYDEVADRMVKELKEHIDSYQSSSLKETPQ